MCTSRRRGRLLAALQITVAVLAPMWVAVAESGSPPGGADASIAVATGRCLAGGAGFFRARIRGALDLDIDWKNAELDCAGESRPDGSGVRISFAGPLRHGRRLRLVFGVSGVREGRPGRELPTNLTVILEGARIFATRGDDKCTVDRLQQQPLRLAGAAIAAHTWRISARGFCVEPANALVGSGRILVSRFDFAGRIAFDGGR